jgi:hypothetical protein
MSAQLTGLGLPDEIVRRAAELLDSQFADASPEVIRARSHAWLESYLTWRFGDAARGPQHAAGEYLKRRLRLKEMEARE